MRLLLDLRSSPYILYQIKDNYILTNCKQEAIVNEKLSNYLNSNEYFSILLDTTKCIISNKEISHYDSLSTDGFWIWSCDLEHYVTNFNLKMPAEFTSYLESNDYTIKPISKEHLRSFYFKKYKSILNEDGQIDIQKLKVIQLS